MSGSNYAFIFADETFETVNEEYESPLTKKRPKILIDMPMDRENKILLILNNILSNSDKSTNSIPFPDVLRKVQDLNNPVF